MYRQKGFTLIELITVIAILGALAVVALPRFLNLQDEANEAALSGVAGAAGSAAAVNLAGALAGDEDFTVVADCADVANAMQGGMPNDYSITASAFATGDSTGAAQDCTLNQVSTGDTTTFTAYYVPDGPS